MRCLLTGVILDSFYLIILVFLKFLKKRPLGFENDAICMRFNSLYPV